MGFFLGLSLALRSHDQIPASHFPFLKKETHDTRHSKSQLYSHVKLLPTLVAMCLEPWKTCIASLRTAFMFGQKLKIDHG